MKTFSYFLFLFLFVSVASSNFNIIIAQGFTQNYFFGLNLVSYDFDSTSDHGFIVTGSEFGNSGDGDYFLMKLDSNGNSQWHQKGGIYNGLAKSNYCQTVKEDSSGNFIAAGILYLTPNDLKLLIVKYDFAGNLIWEKQYGNDNRLVATQIFIIDSLYLIFYFNDDTDENFILQLNLNGDSLGSFPINGATTNLYQPIIQQFSYFEYAGWRYDSLTFSYKWVVSKIDIYGNNISEIEPTDTTSETGVCLIKESDESFYLLTKTYSDSLILKHIDSSGHVFWSLPITNYQNKISLTKSSNKIFIGTIENYFSIDTSGTDLNVYSANINVGFTRMMYKDSSLFYMGVTSSGTSTPWYTVFIKIPESTLSITESFKSDYIKFYYNGKDICISSEVNLGKSSFYIFNIEGELLSYRVLDNELATIENSINRIFINCEINSGIYIGYLVNPKLKLKYAQKLIIY